MVKRSRRGLATIALLGALSLVAAACGDDDDSGGGQSAATTASGGATTTAGEQEGERPVRGGSLTIATLTNPRTLDVTGLAGVNGSTGHGTIGFALYDMLAYQDFETFEVKLQTAESLTTRDGVVWTLKLKPNIKFSDGTPYDAEAVKFTIERHKADARSFARSAADTVASMRVVDPLTLELTLVAPNQQFARLMASPLAWVVSPTAAQAKGDQFGASPVGAGPFMLKNYVQGGRIEMVRNPNYWNQPLPYLDEFVVAPIPDEQQRFNSMAAGQADIVFSSTPRAVKEAKDAGREAVVWHANGGKMVVMNHGRPPLDDIRVREAVTVGLDLEANRAISQGEPVTNLFGESSPFHEPDLTLPKYNPDRARQLFAQYVAEKGPIDLKLIVSSSNTEDAEWVAAQLGRYPDVKVSIEAVDSSASTAARASGNFDLSISSLIAGDPVPIFERTFDSKNSFNHSRYFNAEMDAALAAGRATTDTAQRKAAYRKAQQLVLRDFATVFMEVYPMGYYLQDHVGYANFDENIPKPDVLWRKT